MVTRWAAHKPAYRFAANWFPDSALAKLFPLTANQAAAPQFSELPNDAGLRSQLRSCRQQFCRRHGLCTDNLNAGVAVLKSAQDGA
jgi:hypothetical protein